MPSKALKQMKKNTKKGHRIAEIGKGKIPTKQVKVTGMLGATYVLRGQSIDKLAKITSHQDRQRMRQYRRRNKAKLKRKSNRRKRKQDMGIKRKKKRLGTASGGYSFVYDGGSNKPKQGRSASSPSRGVSASGTSFNPAGNTRSTYRPSKLGR